ncbi:DUF72 domain-containing protein [Pedobacter steynii]
MKRKKFLDNYYSGTSGLLLPVQNKSFYPEAFKEKSRLCFYGSLMNSIEINSSFYKVPMASTVAKWATEVPENFRFTFKLSRDITHNKGLAFDPAAVLQFMQVIGLAGARKGALLVQFPASVRIAQFRQLALLVSTLRESDKEKDWDISLEFRHASLYQDEVYRLLEMHEMGIVIQDKPPATPVMEAELPFVYLRFHGPDGNYRGSYEDDVLCEYADYIHDWMSQGKRVYCYFNNTMGQAIDNLLTLRHLVIGRDHAH